MTTDDIAKRLVDTLVQTCAGFQFDYDVKEVQRNLDYVLRTATDDMRQEKLPI